MAKKPRRSRTEALRELLASATLSTQEELAEALLSEGFPSTQSTISRDLKRLSAIKGTDASGNTIYRLPEQSAVAVRSAISNRNLGALLLSINHNGSMIVIHTPPGSANLLARHLDVTKPDGILGTIAGDDTVFVAPSSPKKIEATIEAILASLE